MSLLNALLTYLLIAVGLSPGTPGSSFKVMSDSAGAHVSVCVLGRHMYGQEPPAGLCFGLVRHANFQNGVEGLCVTKAPRSLSTISTAQLMLRTSWLSQDMRLRPRHRDAPR